ncbi:hypothetical protein AT03_13935 [Hafnia alvei FB1]|uniref:Polymerase n=2 Tax=Hafnia alvei TaxID=569 RepID=A0A097R3T0_HAFAL|nr:oligosaccharide repeat unit polymerase [Hafnia alvei]AIU73378.1 hypothetical protein AT03_13935 [Hafnia alvei FB1]ANF29983.1 hypothetical protein [Hafnia alvei]TBL63613.1 hypothetical protein EYY92_01885 [Hafnia alvei]
MKISPAGLILCVYFIANLYFGLDFYISGTLGGDFVGKPIENENVFLYAYSGEIFSMLIFFSLLYLISKFSYKNTTYHSAGLNGALASKFNDSFVSIVIFFVQIAFLIYSFMTGVGRLADDYYNATVDNPIKYFFTFFNADYLFLAYYSVTKKKSKFNLLIYLVSNLFRGWIAGALLNVFLLYLIKNYSGRKISIKKILILFLFFVLLAPSLYYVKYVTRGAQQDISLDAVSSYYTSDVRNKITNAVFERFQHISETYSCVNEISILRAGYEDGQFVPFYLDNFLKKPLMNVFGIKSDRTITQYAAEEILVKKPGNIHVGILTWVLIEPLLTIGYILYIVTGFILLCLLLRSLANELIWPISVWASAMFAMHGWFSAFFMLIWSYFLIYILSKVRSKIR